MQLTFVPGANPSVGTLTTPWFAPAEAAQTIAPGNPIVTISGTVVFTTNLPGVWTSTIGSIVAAADGLSATFTAPGGAASGTVTVTNEDDPGNIASTTVHVTGFGPLSQGEVIYADGGGLSGTAGRSIVGI